MTVQSAAKRRAATSANGTAPAGAVRMVPVADISPSPLNPRRTFDEASLRDLAGSLATVGLIQPITVRPHPPLSGRYELVVGERRWRAAQIAGWAEIPAIVKELTDQQVLEVQLIEDVQRADIPELERAAGFGRLVEEHGVTVEEIAARISRSVSTVRDLLRLRDLPDVARAALADGTIPASTAKAIARVPGSAARERIARLVLAGEDWYGREGEAPTDAELAKRRAAGHEPYTFRAARELIAEVCHVELKGAPFPTKSLDLVPTAGSCDECPKRAGNLAQSDLEYAGVRADVCTDPDCFRQKVEAQAARVVAAALDSGRPVLAGDEARGLFTSWGGHELKSGGPWIDLAAECKLDAKGRGWQKLVGKALKDEIAVAIDPAGVARQLVPKERAAEILKEQHGIGGAGKDSARPESAEDQRWRKEQAEERRKTKLAKEAARAANGQVAAEMQAVFGGMVAAEMQAVFGGMVGAAWPRSEELLRAVVQHLAEIAWSDACRQVMLRRGAGEGVAGAARDAIRTLAGSATAPELLGLIAELVAARRSLEWGPRHEIDAPEKAWWKTWGVDPAALLKATGKQAKRKKGKTKREPESTAAEPARPPDMAGLITRETWLVDILPGTEESASAAAVLEGAGLSSVGDLLRRAAAEKGPDKQRPYSVLRQVPGLDILFVNQIGDALIDAGLVVGPEDAAPSEGWRGEYLADMGLSKNATKFLRGKGLLTAGAIADWVDGTLLAQVPMSAAAKEAQAAIEVLRSAAAPPGPAEKLAKAAKERRCRVCGATEADLPPADTFVSDDLCSGCEGEEATHAESRGHESPTVRRGPGPGCRPAQPGPGGAAGLAHHAQAGPARPV